MKIRTAFDTVSAINVVGVLMGFLPVIAALMTIIYTGLRIWEMKTVQDWVRRG